MKTKIFKGAKAKAEAAYFTNSQEIVVVNCVYFYDRLDEEDTVIIAYYI